MVAEEDHTLEVNHCFLMGMFEVKIHDEVIDEDVLMNRFGMGRERFEWIPSGGMVYPSIHSDKYSSRMNVSFFLWLRAS